MKKVRKFARGGSTEGENPNITPDVRARALMFASMVNDREAQDKFQKSIHDAQQAAAEKTSPRSAPAQRPTSSGGSDSARAPSGGSGPATAPAGNSSSMEPRISRPTPQAYSSDDFDPDEAPADAAAASRRSAAASRRADAAATRGTSTSESTSTRTPTRVLPVSSFEEENNARVARNRAAAQEREALKSLARGIERTDKDLEEARAKPNPALRSAMGERQARQMEEKGSVFSKDFGKPKAEREAAKRSMDDALEETRTRGTSTPRSKNVSAMGERQAKQMEEKGSIYSKDFGKPPSERDRPNYPTAERVRAEERRQMAGESARDREDMDTGIAKSKSRSEAGAKRKQEEEAKAKPNPALRSAMGERQAKQMEEKGSIYSRDFGKSKAERDAIKAGERSDRREQARQAAEERDRRRRERIRQAAEERDRRRRNTASGSVQGASFKSGGMVGSASKRGDGIASKGKTRGRIY